MEIFKNLRMKQLSCIYITASTLYAVIYNYIFDTYILTAWSYMIHNEYRGLNVNMYALYLTIAVSPILFFRGVTTIASGLSMFVYLFAYVPIINTALTVSYGENTNMLPYIIVFFFSMCLFFKTDNHYLSKQTVIKRKKIPFRYFIITSLLVFVVLVLTNLNSIRFVNFFTDSERMYDFRELNGNAVGAIYGYFFCWMKYVSLPLLFLYSLKNKQIIYTVLLIIAFAICFMIDMQKVTFFIPFIIAGSYVFYNKSKELFAQYFYVVIVGFLIVASLVLVENQKNPIFFALAAVFIMRTMCMEGILFDTYFSFFEVNHHSYTYYSHINIIGAIFGGNPYAGTPIGQVVSEGDANANACFWLMDGLTSCGLIGLVFSSILFIIFKSFINNIGREYNPKLCLIVLLFAITAMVNVSLSTVLLTYGFLVFYFVLKKFDVSWINDKSK